MIATTVEPILTMLDSARPRRIRSFTKFAEDEVVLARGPRAGLKFRCSYSPWTASVLKEFDNPHWNRRFGMGAVQSGKTLVYYVIPALYHLFEIGETVILAAPTMEMAQRRYDVDIKPVIQKTRYASMLPTHGSGSRGGKSTDILFNNGARLIFMSGGGSDASRSSETARVVLITEADKMDEAGEASQEAAPVFQLEARTSSYGEDALFYGECTVSVEEGYIYHQVKEYGSGGRIYVRCRHCGQYVYPEREHLQGVQAADDEMAAREIARLACPSCGVAWNEEDRQDALQSTVLCHKGQEIAPDGTVKGPMPRTRTLGVEWNWVASPMTPLTQIAVMEWHAARAVTQDEEKALLQFRWVKPWKDKERPVTLSFSLLAERACDVPFDPFRAISSEGPKTALPDEAAFCIGTIDVQKRWLYIALDAYAKDYTCWTLLWHVVQVVAEGSRAEPTEQDLRTALDEARHILMDVCGASSIWVDAGYRYEGFQSHPVREWCHEQGDGVNALVGRSSGQQQRLSGKVQDLPASVPADIVQCRLQDDGSLLWFFDVDKLKDDVYARLFRQPGSPGCRWFAREAANPERTSRSMGPGSHGWIFQHYMRVKRIIEAKKDGRQTRRWEESGQHDLWDLAGYGLAGAWVTAAELESEAAQDPLPGSPPQFGRVAGIRTKY